MKISRAVNHSYQMLLFDLPIGNYGSIRGTIGKWSELLTLCLVEGSKRHITDNTCDYCPDISSDGIYYETKSVGKSNQAFIYEGRLYKDWMFAQHHQLNYIIWNHATITSEHETDSSLFQGFMATLHSVYIIPFWLIYSVARRRPLEKLNSKYGPTARSSKQEPMYGHGYRISLGVLSDYRIKL